MLAYTFELGLSLLAYFGTERVKRLQPLLVAVALLALALPQAALAKGEFDPVEEFEQHEWVPIHLGPARSVDHEGGRLPDARNGADDLRRDSSSCVGPR